jgi:uncharacterized protein
VEKRQFDAIVYHERCQDGILGLWCANRNSKIENVYACNAGVDPTKHFENENVIFVDICPSFDYMLSVIKQVKKIVILDHHKSSADVLEKHKNILEEYDNIEIVFDMHRSGCQIAWDYFFPNESRPFFVDYVADRDLWQWKLPMSKEVNSALYELDYINSSDFSKLDELSNSDNREEHIKKIGKIR